MVWALQSPATLGGQPQKSVTKSSKHMSEQDSIDILSESNDVDLSSVDTNFPVLPKGAYRCVVSDVKIVASKSREGGKNLEIKLKLNQEADTTAGKHLTPDSNFPITFYVGMTPTEKYPPNDIKRNLGQFYEGVLGVAKRKAGGNLQPLEQFIGQEVHANLAIDDDPAFGTRNSVKNLIKKP